MTRGLSKSRFMLGWKCPKLLWYKANEPDGPEWVSDRAAQDRMEQGSAVGALAREDFPGGVLIDLPYDQYQEKIETTRKALEAGASAIFEASFYEDGVFVAVDVLERTDDGFTLIEVKSTSGLKAQHTPDAAVQYYVLREAGIPVQRVELMHLNKQHRRPDVGPLFVRDDVTAGVLDLQPRVPEAIAEMRDTLGGEIPDIPIGLHCVELGDCPFHARCWPLERDSILSLRGKGKKKALPLIEAGLTSVLDVPDDMDGLNDVARRQLRAVRSGKVVVEPGLRGALDSIEAPIGFLDFETIGRALPPWDGIGPWSVIPVQFSYHELQPDGEYTHVEWLADGPEDPCEPLARALVEACRDAGHVLMYTTYERTQISTLIERVPQLASELEELKSRLFDLEKIVEDYVYHPDFQGSFSLKPVLPALVPDLGYDDLVIQGGMDASVEIARMLLRPETFEPGEREQLRTDLLAYCERDTWAMVRLLEVLRGMASEAGN